MIVARIWCPTGDEASLKSCIAVPNWRFDFVVTPLASPPALHNYDWGVDCTDPAGKQAQLVQWHAGQQRLCWSRRCPGRGMAAAAGSCQGKNTAANWCVFQPCGGACVMAQPGWVRLGPVRPSRVCQASAGPSRTGSQPRACHPCNCPCTNPAAPVPFCDTLPHNRYCSYCYPSGAFKVCVAQGGATCQVSLRLGTARHCWAVPGAAPRCDVIERACTH